MKLQLIDNQLNSLCFFFLKKVGGALPAVFCLLSLTGCQSEESLPVSDEKMIEVLADVHIAESVMTFLNQQQQDSMAPVYYDQIMLIHDLDREVFDTCLAILRRNPDRMHEIYTEVFEKLEKEKLELDQAGDE